MYILGLGRVGVSKLLGVVVLGLLIGSGVGQGMLSGIEVEAATLRWTGDGLRGNWSNPDNWNLDRVPGPADSVTIEGSGDDDNRYYINVDVDVEVEYLDIQSSFRGTLDANYVGRVIKADSIFVSADVGADPNDPEYFDNVSSVDFGRATLELTESYSGNHPNDLGGNLVFKNDPNVNNSSISVAANSLGFNSVLVEQGVVLTVSGSSSLRFGSNGDFVNNGNVNVLGNIFVNGATTTGPGSRLAAYGMEFTGPVTNAGEIETGNDSYVSFGGEVRNSGTIRSRNGNYNDPTRFYFGNVDFTNTGTFAPGDANTVTVSATTRDVMFLTGTVPVKVRTYELSSANGYAISLEEDSRVDANRITFPTGFRNTVQETILNTRTAAGELVVDGSGARHYLNLKEDPFFPVYRDLRPEGVRISNSELMVGGVRNTQPLRPYELDTNDNAPGWIPSQRPTVLISEVQYDAPQAGEDTNYEWLEVYNYGSESMSMSEWFLQAEDSRNWTRLPTGFKVAANSYAVLVNDEDGFGENYVRLPDVDMSQSQAIVMGDEAEQLRLVDVYGRTIDEVFWEGRNSWTLETAPGETLCRKNVNGDTDTQADWEVCVESTPGTARVAAVDELMVEFREAAYAVSEDGVALELLLEVSGGDTTGGEVQSVGIVVTGGTAQGGGVDYTFGAGKGVVIPADDYTATKTIAVPLGVSDDMMDEGIDETILLELRTPSGQVSIGGQGATTVTILEDDTAQILVETITDALEGETEGVFSVRLDAQPEAEKRVRVVSGDETVVGVEDELLRFTTTNYDVPQVVRMTGVEDADLEDTEIGVTLSIVEAEESAYDFLETDVQVTVRDVDTAGIVMTPEAALELAEGEAREVAYQVALSQEPAVEIVLAVESSETGVRVQPSTLTYTPENWDTVQAVRVSAAQDDDAQDMVATVTVRGLSGEWTGLSETRGVQVTDDEEEIDPGRDTDGDTVPDTDEDTNGSDKDNPDDDNDGVSTQVERAAPNDGDGNGDGEYDYTQDAVVSAVNVVTGDYTTLVGTGSCENITEMVTMREADNAASDETAEYPLGLYGFEMGCGQIGGTGTVEIILDKVYDTSEWVYKKYQGGVYTPMTGVVYGVTTVGGVEKTTITYTLMDGGANDEDGVANGRIVDPAGPSVFVSQDTDTTEDTDTTDTVDDTDDTAAGAAPTEDTDQGGSTPAQLIRTGGDGRAWSLYGVVLLISGLWCLRRGQRL